MQNSSEYINRLKYGDIDAFETLYNHWSGRLYNFVLKVSSHDGFQAEDIVQSVFVKIWEIRESLDPNKSFGSFVYTIAKNMIRNMHQHQMYKVLYTEKAQDAYEDSIATQRNSIEEELDYEFLHNIINQFIEELPTERKKIFLLSRKQYLTNKQIAKELGISVNTVESQMTKAIATLRLKLSQSNLLLTFPLINIITFELLNKS